MLRLGGEAVGITFRPGGQWGEVFLPTRGWRGQREPLAANVGDEGWGLLGICPSLSGLRSPEGPGRPMRARGLTTSC